MSNISPGAVAATAGGAPWPTQLPQLVTTTSTVTIPTGATRAFVQIMAPGGGGAGDDNAGTAGSGGGAGVFGEQWFSGLTPGSTLAATVPAGGAGGVEGVSGGVGTAGAQASLASGTQTITTMSVNGGSGGKNDSTAVAVQTTSSGCLFSVPGQGRPVKLSTSSMLYFIGSDSLWGSGGYQTAVVTGNGTAASGYGAGGGGSGTTASNGGNGAPALMKIWWFT